MKERNELEAAREVLAMVGALYAVGADAADTARAGVDVAPFDAASAPPRGSRAHARPREGHEDPTVQEVLTALGYVVAVRARRRHARGADPAGDGDAALEVLQAVAQQWLRARTEAGGEAAGPVETAAAYYDRMARHVRHLGGERTDPPLPFARD